MRKIIRTGLLMGLAGLLAACPRPVRPPAPAPGPAPAVPADVRGAAVYAIDPQGSEVHVLVFRGGALARLGHNHVVSSQRLTGRIWVHSDWPRSGFEMSFPVNELVVDDPEARRAAGSEFAADVPQADKDGTRRNMLRPELLDAQRYPQVTLTAARVAGTLEEPRITARITIKDVSREVEVVPAKVTIDSGRVHASGEFDVRQTEFGIKPFSAALGALEVQDPLRIKFKIVAERTKQ